MGHRAVHDVLVIVIVLVIVFVIVLVIVVVIVLQEIRAKQGCSFIKWAMSPHHPDDKVSKVNMRTKQGKARLLFHQVGHKRVVQHITIIVIVIFIFIVIVLCHTQKTRMLFH